MQKEENLGLEAKSRVRYTTPDSPLINLPAFAAPPLCAKKLCRQRGPTLCLGSPEESMPYSAHRGGGEAEKVHRDRKILSKQIIGSKICTCTSHPPDWIWQNQDSFKGRDFWEERLLFNIARCQIALLLECCIRKYDIVGNISKGNMKWKLNILI